MTSNPLAPPPDAPTSVTARARFREGLREHGFVEGPDYGIDYVWEERVEQVAARMRVLLLSGPDLVVTLTTPVALAAAKATRKVPIVFGTVSDPVASGLVESLARPGGNVTGVANVLPALSGKLIELMVNLRTARAIGIEVPRSILLRANRVIE